MNYLAAVMVPRSACVLALIAVASRAPRADPTSLTLLSLLVIPAIHVVWRSFQLGRPQSSTGKLGESP